jgi:hypothetical protein
MYSLINQWASGASMTISHPADEDAQPARNTAPITPRPPIAMLLAFPIIWLFEFTDWLWPDLGDESDWPE